ncbi:MAG: trypsin-like peptidase domain-containing protein, partial [Phycisphaeraceae bacterium]|nr:trypsin-like peptidase domain-containing protein [Phycisphaeraceae bacterium]
REDWPERDDPLFAYAVWIHTPGGWWGSGVLIHSSDRGTYVLTAAHVASDDDGYAHADGKIEVGVWAQSHTSTIQEPHATYVADVVASTSARAPTSEDPDAGTAAMVDWIFGRDLAILRLRTDRRFVTAPLYTGSSDEIRDVPMVVVAVVPEMYPHRKSASLVGEKFLCPDSVDGNSGAPIFADGRVVGLCTSEILSPGPKLLDDFIRAHEEIRFLLETAAGPTGGMETPASEGQRGR